MAGFCVITGESVISYFCARTSTVFVVQEFEVRVHSPVAVSDCEIASRDDGGGQFALSSWLSRSC